MHKKTDTSPSTEPELSAQEKLLSSVDQLAQVLDIIGKLVHRIRYQIEALPRTNEYKNQKVSSTMTQASNKEDSVLH